jgi:glycosyltransferase involved in cell wall biosynthesis
MHNASVVLTEGHFQVKKMKELGFGERVHLASFGIGLDIERIRSLATLSNDRSHIRMQNQSKIGITANRLVAQKGIDVLIRAVALVAVKHSSFRMLIVGDGPEEGALRQLVDQLKVQEKIHFVGSVGEEELYPLIQSADVYVSPTFHEDWVLGVGEAMALGRPVISTGQEWLVKNGLNGFLVKKDNPQELANALESFLRLSDEEQSAMGKASCEIISEYSIASLASRLVGFANTNEAS